MFSSILVHTSTGDACHPLPFTPLSMKDARLLSDTMMKKCGLYPHHDLRTMCTRCVEEVRM